jgi:alpha-ketoglutarate-dependent taurine dioxygenase
MADPLQIRSAAGSLGAEVSGLSADRLDESAARQLMDALSTHLVLFLPGLAPRVEQFTLHSVVDDTKERRLLHRWP